jgi:hypothetical protein
LIEKGPESKSHYFPERRTFLEVDLPKMDSNIPFLARIDRDPKFNRENDGELDVGMMPTASRILHHPE